LDIPEFESIPALFVIVPVPDKPLDHDVFPETFKDDNNVVALFKIVVPETKNCDFKVI
jgi:hypothetical protein